MLLFAATLALADPALLFMGNSYTQNQGLDLTTRSLFEVAQPGTTASRLAAAGYTLPLHLAQADGTYGDTAWREALVTGSASWTFVVMQDQSQIPGFPKANAEVQASLAALDGLDPLIAAKGGTSVLLMTWGRRLGDEANPDVFPDFLTMQALLQEGYERYAERISTESRLAVIAPAGLAWQEVYEDAIAAGETPEDAGTLFSRLYEPDGSHPSPLGNYMAACVVYAALAGETPVGLPAPSELAAADVALVQDAAHAAVFVRGAAYSYPWSGGDTGEGDSGAGAPDPNDSAEETGASETASTPRKNDSGCGCASTHGAAAGWALGLGALLVTRRRR